MHKGIQLAETTWKVESVGTSPSAQSQARMDETIWSSWTTSADLGDDSWHWDGGCKVGEGDPDMAGVVAGNITVEVIDEDYSML